MHALSESPEPRIWAGHGLKITVRTRHTLQAALVVTGELDLASAPLLRACLENQLANGRRYSRLDLAGVTFIDAAGLSVLLDTHEAFLQRRGMVVVTALSSKVSRIVRLLGVEHTLMISRDPDASAAVVPVAGQASPDRSRPGGALRIVH